MMDDGIIPSRSSHPSLRAHNIPPDLKFVIIDNVYINDFLLTIRDKIILGIYNFVKKLGSNDFIIDWRNMSLSDNLYAVSRWNQDIMNNFDDEEDGENLSGKWGSGS